VTSPLAKLQGLSGLEQQSDMLRLARRGNRECARIWNQFAEQDPGMARLVIKSVDADDRAAAKASRRVGKVLSRAEPVVVKSAEYAAPVKPKKARKAARKAAEVAFLSKMAGPPVRSREEAVQAVARADLAADLYSSDPDRRAKAWDARFRGLI
jgi:hypothetical protein